MRRRLDAHPNLEHMHTKRGWKGLVLPWALRLTSTILPRVLFTYAQDLPTTKMGLTFWASVWHLVLLQVSGIEQGRPLRQVPNSPPCHGEGACCGESPQARDLQDWSLLQCQRRALGVLSVSLPACPDAGRSWKTEGWDLIAVSSHTKQWTQTFITYFLSPWDTALVMLRHLGRWPGRRETGLLGPFLLDGSILPVQGRMPEGGKLRLA